VVCDIYIYIYIYIVPACSYFVITDTGVDLFRLNIWALGVFVDKNFFFIQ
jgi:hypothetical protein